MLGHRHKSVLLVLIPPLSYSCIYRYLLRKIRFFRLNVSFSNQRFESFRSAKFVLRCSKLIFYLSLHLQIQLCRCPQQLWQVLDSFHVLLEQMIEELLAGLLFQEQKIKVRQLLKILLAYQLWLLCLLLQLIHHL